MVERGEPKKPKKNLLNRSEFDRKRIQTVHKHWGKDMFGMKFFDLDIIFFEIFVRKKNPKKKSKKMARN